jgi:hypothetical protein
MTLLLKNFLRDHGLLGPCINSVYFPDNCQYATQSYGNALTLYLTSLNEMMENDGL